MYRTWAVRRYDDIVKIFTLYLEKLISCYCFLNKYSKEFFYHVVGIHKRKEDFEKKRCNVPFELRKGISKIIITVKR